MEIMIIIDYLLQIFTSLKCNGFESYSYLSIDVSYSGLHQHPAKAIPLFLAYLSVLSYTSSFRIAQCFRKDANPAISREPTSGGPQSTALLERPGCDAGGRAVGGVEGLDGPGRKRLKVVLTGTRDGVCVVHRYQGEMDSAQRQDTARGRFGGGKGLTASEQARGLWSALVQEGMRGMMRALNFVESTATSSERRPFFARVIVALNTTSPPFPVEAKEDWDDDAARDMVEERVRESHERMETFLQKVLDTIREQQVRVTTLFLGELRPHPHPHPHPRHTRRPCSPRSREWTRAKGPPRRYPARGELSPAQGATRRRWCQPAGQRSSPRLGRWAGASGSLPPSSSTAPETP